MEKGLFSLQLGCTHIEGFQVLPTSQLDEM